MYPKLEAASSTLHDSYALHLQSMEHVMPMADAYLDPQSRFISIDGTRVHFKREGRGDAVVLLHGSGSSLHCFDAITDLLKEHFEVIRLDLPGHGLTAPRGDRDYRIGAYVSFLKKFVTELGLDRFSLVGNSLGGNVAWNFALDHAQCLQHLVLMNATGYPEKSLPLAMRVARLPFGGSLIKAMFSRRATARNLRGLMGTSKSRLDDKLIDRVHALMSIPANLQAFIEFARTDQVDRSHEIALIRVPTLILRGESVDGQNFRRDIKHSQEIVFSGAGRLLPDEVPDKVASTILRQLTSTSHGRQSACSAR